ncbi:peptidase associated/transthyretin-like domain-containing protein [Aquimarina sediminis]|uniref:hypothetical protein n=1 Tax=Aquimarina sediminis TaxID=2070536 RepID=UPI000CA0145F|nr:hypothetical protein [Aquimarina sediminis]
MKTISDDIWMAKILQLLFLIISISSFGQSQILKGKIVADSLQGYAINIVNFTKKLGTTNEDNGFFEIPASSGDSIVFSSVQYQIRSIVVSPSQLKEERVRIVLSSVVQQLEQVKISDIKLSGNLNKDVGGVELQPFVDNQILGLPFNDKPQPTLPERRIYTARSGILDLPINYLSGKLKKLKVIKELDDLQRLVYNAETTFNTAFFVDDLAIPEDLITDFMYYCADDDYFKDLLSNSQRLTLLEFFQKKSISYRKLKEID